MMTEIEGLGAIVFLIQVALLVGIVYGVRRYMKSRKSRKGPTSS